MGEEHKQQQKTTEKWGNCEQPVVVKTVSFDAGKPLQASELKRTVTGDKATVW